MRSAPCEPCSARRPWASPSVARGLTRLTVYRHDPTSSRRACDPPRATRSQGPSPGGLLAPPGVPAGTRSGFGAPVAPPFAPYGDDPTEPGALTGA
jgi:hypothetical protein